MDDDDILILLYKKNNHRYVFMYDDGRERDVTRLLIKFAMNDDLDFDFHDAIELNNKVLAMERK